MSADERSGYAVKLRSKRVQQELDSLKGTDYQRVIVKLRSLELNPRPKGCEKVFGDIYRVRVGDIRIIYQVTDSLKLVEVGAVRRRSEKTYKDISDLF
jgi:mRNA interferase RelE/StbE